MLLQRKSLAFVAPSGEKYLIFMLLKVRKWTVIRGVLRGGAEPPPISANIRPNADCLAWKFEIWSVDSREND